MKLRRRPSRKIIVICPRCGKRQNILVGEKEFMVICPRCGAGMRESQIRSRLDK